MNLRSARSACLLAAAALPLGCANFKKLGVDLDFLAHTYTVTAIIENAPESSKLVGVVMEWDAAAHKVNAVDRASVGALGVFAFFVKSAQNQYVMAFSDTNGNSQLDAGEPSWVHSDPEGHPTPLEFDPRRTARASGRLAVRQGPSSELLAAVREFRGTKTIEETLTGWNIPIALGEIADLDDPRFSAVRGEQGLWLPASFPRESGFGIFFLEPYDARRIPVLFVYGAAGSPQDWRTFFASLDRSKYQAWFVLYPSGRRLDESSSALNRAVSLLHERLAFTTLHVVAHSMGGLVSRSFIVKNLEDGNHYVRRFVSISTPWGGHEAAAMGVKFSKLGPPPVPSWRDMVTASPFQKAIQTRLLKGEVDHLLLYGHHRSRSLVLPRQNDGVVSVKSQTLPAAVKDAVMAIGFDADHVGILSRPEVIQTAQEFLDARLTATPRAGAASR
jgi:hypothetical protein